MRAGHQLKSYEDDVFIDVVTPLHCIVPRPLSKHSTLTDIHDDGLITSFVQATPARASILEALYWYLYSRVGSSFFFLLLHIFLVKPHRRIA